MSSDIPFLPGYRIDTNPKRAFHKSHMFDVHNGIRVDMKRDVNSSFNGTNLLGEDPLVVTTGPASLHNTGAYNATTQHSATSRGENLPAWVAYDSKVLRFYAHFKEPVYSSPVENFRVRKCIIYYYLEDDTIHIAEPKVENSGINQGVILRRHRIPKNNGEYISVGDLSICEDLAIYGRVYRLTDCDAFTRAFFEANGRPLPYAEETPVDAFTKKHTTRVSSHNKMMHPFKQYLEASLGKSMYGTDIEGTQKFLRNDGKVLRFFCTWDDPQLFGELRPYVLHYFLADDTVEVLEIQQSNSGRDPFPALLKRGKLPRNYRDHASDVSRIGIRNEQEIPYYKDTDLQVGNYVTVYGRQLLLCAADKFTQRYYIENYNLTPADFPQLNLEEEIVEPPQLLPPPHTGFGSEEDSLGSFLYLMQKVPKQDFKKLMENDGVSIRFMAKFINAKPEDRERKFIVTFYLADDTISIFEKHERNSGFVGGKFLERMRVKNSVTGEYFKPQDFYAGGKIVVNSYVFDLIDVDESTVEWMQQNSHVFGHELLQKQSQYIAQKRATVRR